MWTSFKNYFQSIITRRISVSFVVLLQGGQGAVDVPAAAEQGSLPEHHLPLQELGRLLRQGIKLLQQGCQVPDLQRP